MDVLWDRRLKCSLSVSGGWMCVQYKGLAVIDPSAKTHLKTHNRRLCYGEHWKTTWPKTELVKFNSSPLSWNIIQLFKKKNQKETCQLIILNPKQIKYSALKGLCIMCLIDHENNSNTFPPHKKPVTHRLLSNSEHILTWYCTADRQTDRQTDRKTVLKSQRKT